MKKLIRYPFEFPINIAWGDMDAFGHVNNVMYAKYFETARADLFSKEEFWNTKSSVLEEGPVLVKMEMEYRKQVKYPATILVTLGIPEITKRGFKVACTMWENEICCASGIAEILWFDFQKQKIGRIPEQIVSYFAKFENLNGQK